MRKLLARAWLRLTGWEPEGARPTAERFVLIAAPHTSNWDLVYLLALAEVYDLRVSWMGKHTLFRPPFGAVFRALGGIAIRRDQRGDRVAAMAKEFSERERGEQGSPDDPEDEAGLRHEHSFRGAPLRRGFCEGMQ